MTLKNLYLLGAPIKKTMANKATIFLIIGIVVVAGILLWMIIQNISSESAVTPTGSTNGLIAGVHYDPDNTALIGLPVENFDLSELHNPSGGSEGDLIQMSGIRDLIIYGYPVFVFARVISTKEWTDKERYNQEMQTSVVHILRTVWSETEMPETLSVNQYKYGGCCANEKTNLLRKGGVYLLPLVYWEETNAWYVVFTEDVLFEVDDRGRIWSHSVVEGFNRFDGQEASAVADAITFFTEDENFSVAMSAFGKAYARWDVLAETTVLSVGPSANEKAFGQIEYQIRLDSILSHPHKNMYGWEVYSGEEITLFPYKSSVDFEPGGRYLLSFAPREGGSTITPMRAAKINDDDTITPLSSPDHDSFFSGYDGYTIAQMKELVERVKAWREKHLNGKE